MVALPATLCCDHLNHVVAFAKRKAWCIDPDRPHADISKTVWATIEDIGRVYFQSWQFGLKATALYRDGCKLSQPLSTKSDESQTKSAGAVESKTANSDASKVIPKG